MRVQHVLQAKGIEHAVELVISEGHRHHVSNYVLVSNSWTGLRRANAHHIGTEVNQSQVHSWLIVPQIPIRSSTSLQHLHKSSFTFPLQSPARVSLYLLTENWLYPLSKESMTVSMEKADCWLVSYRCEES